MRASRALVKRDYEGKKERKTILKFLSEFFVPSFFFLPFTMAETAAATGSSSEKPNGSVSPHLPTPEYFHCIANPKFRNNVYEPEADTFLFLEALQKDREVLRCISPKRCVEIGCGSGTVITFLHTLFCPPNAEDAPDARELQSVPSCMETAFYAVDINPMALQAASCTWASTSEKQYPGDISEPLVCPVGAGEAWWSALGCLQEETKSREEVARRHAPLHLIEGDLLSPFPSSAVFDIMLFNPPYVPTSLSELDDAISKRDVLTAAWCGGPRGRVVIDRFLSLLPTHLATPGFCYLVLIKENDIEDVKQTVLRVFRGSDETQEVKSCITFETVAERYTGEHLGVYRISRGFSSPSGT